MRITKTKIRRASTDELWWVIVIPIIFILTTIYCLPLFDKTENLGVLDWDQQLFYYGSFLKTIIEYEQFPFWNPWYCGGSVLFQHPQIPILSITYLLAPLVGLLLAAKISVAIHYGIALLGMTLLARRVYKLSNIFAIVLASTFFVFTSYFSLRVAAGHPFTSSIAYIPFIFLGYELYLSERRVGWLVFGSAVFALIVWTGGIYPAPIMALFMCGYGVLRAVIEKDVTPIRALIFLGGYAFLFSAPKLIPVVEYLIEYPRIALDREYIPPIAWFDIFLGREQSLFLDWTTEDVKRPGHQTHLPAPSMQWDWWEYGCYIGIPLALLFVVAVFGTNISSEKKSFRSRYLVLLVCWFGFFILFVGDFADVNPYRVLKKFPIASSLHVTGRFLIVLMFISSLLLMGYLTQLEAKHKIKRSFRYIMTLACILIVSDVMLVGAKPFSEAFTIEPKVFDRVTEDIVRDESPYQVIVDLPTYGSFSTMYAALTADLAILHGLSVQPQCYEPIHPRVGYELGKPLVFSPSSGLAISNIRFTPNQITFDLDADDDGQIILNQNFVKGWTFSGKDAVVEQFRNKPMVKIRSGTYSDLNFYFLPPGIWLGVALFLLGVLIVGIHLRFKKN